MRIALLGATSATGRHVIGSALRDGHEVRAMVRGARPGTDARELPCKGGLVQLSGTSTDLLPRHVRILERWGGAADHPRLPAFPEGDYLKCVLLAMD